MSKVITRAEAIQLLKDGYILFAPLLGTAFIATGLNNEPTVRQATVVWLQKHKLIERQPSDSYFWRWKTDPSEIATLKGN